MILHIGVTLRPCSNKAEKNRNGGIENRLIIFPNKKCCYFLRRKQQKINVRLCNYLDKQEGHSASSKNRTEIYPVAIEFYWFPLSACCYFFPFYFFHPSNHLYIYIYMLYQYNIYAYLCLHNE